MKFHVNKITAVALVVFASCAIFGGFWLQSNQSGGLDEPGRPQTPLSGLISSLTPGPYKNIKHANEQSVVRFNDGANIQNFLEVNDLSSSDLQAVTQLTNTYVIDRSKNLLEPVGAQVLPQLHYSALLVPNDPISSQWYTDKISAPTAWDITTGSSSIIVADIDTGFALNHEDLVGRWAPGGWDFVHNDNDPSAGTDSPSGIGVSHGSETAGLIGATGNNAKGVASVNWGAKILPLQALDDNGEGTSTDVASAIHYAVDQGAKVINMSLGSASPDPIVKAELDYAQSHDVVVVAAAGNCGDSNFSDNGCSTQGQMVYPANYPQVLAVGATDINDVRASFSSYGSNLDVVAPGSGTIQTTAWSAGNQTSYTTNINGTSFSSPIVAGLAALYRGYNTASSASGTITAITSSADKLSTMAGQNFANEYGFGRVNAAHTLSGTPPAPANPAPAPTPPETTPTPLPHPSIAVAHPDGTLIFNSNGSGVEIVQDGKRAPIISGAVFTSNGHSWESVKTPTAGDKELVATTAYPYREGTLLESQGHIYVVDIPGSGTQQKRGITSWDVFVGLGYKESDLLHVSSDVLPAVDGPDLSDANQHPDGTLIYTADRSGVVLIQSGQRRNIVYADIFNSYGYQWSQIKNPTGGDNSLPTGPDLANFRDGTLLGSQGRVYAADLSSGGIAQKRWINSWDLFVAFGYSISEIVNVPSYELPAADGPVLSL